jgi:hypothetical protein
MKIIGNQFVNNPDVYVHVVMHQPVAQPDCGAPLRQFIRVYRSTAGKAGKSVIG